MTQRYPHPAEHRKFATRLRAAAARLRGKGDTARAAAYERVAQNNSDHANTKGPPR